MKYEVHYPDTPIVEKYNTKEEAELVAKKLNGKVIPIAENVEEQDMLEGHPYPGHECWDD